MLTDWQKETLSATYLNAEVWAMFGEKIPRLHIMRTDKDSKMDILDIIRVVKESTQKPLIHKPDNPFEARYATKKEVLDFLKKRI